MNSDHEQKLLCTHLYLINKVSLEYHVARLAKRSVSVRVRVPDEVAGGRASVLSERRKSTKTEETERQVREGERE